MQRAKQNPEAIFTFAQIFSLLTVHASTHTRERLHSAQRSVRGRGGREHREDRQPASLNRKQTQQVHSMTTLEEIRTPISDNSPSTVFHRITQHGFSNVLSISKQTGKRYIYRKISPVVSAGQLCLVHYSTFLFIQTWALPVQAQSLQMGQPKYP